MIISFFFKLGYSVRPGLHLRPVAFCSNAAAPVDLCCIFPFHLLYLPPFTHDVQRDNKKEKTKGLDMWFTHYPHSTTSAEKNIDGIWGIKGQQNNNKNNKRKAYKWNERNNLNIGIKTNAAANVFKKSLRMFLKQAYHLCLFWSCMHVHTCMFKYSYFCM